MQEKMQVMIGTQDLGIWQRFAGVVDSKDLSLVPFQSIGEAVEGLARRDVLLIFCENQLADGSYEDLLTAAKRVNPNARIVVTGLDSDQFDALGFCRARELGAFDVLRKSYGIKDLEWILICAMRDEMGARTATAA